MISYEEFKETISKDIKKYLPEEYRDAEVYIDKVLQNNNRLGDSLRIRKEGEALIPQVHLKDYYDRYVSTGSLEKTLSKLAVGFQNNSVSKIGFEGAYDILDYEKVKEKLIIQLINQESNQKILSGIPHKAIENTDLVATFCILLHEGKDGRSSMKVTQDMFLKWNMDVDTLYEISLANTIKNNPFVLNTMENIFFWGDFGKKNCLPENLEAYVQYVLTTEKRQDGAVTLLYPGLLDRIAERFGGNFFVLPNTINEVILMKDDGIISAQKLQQIVMEVDVLEVMPEEVLSHQVFSYNKEGHTLTMATSPEETRKLMERLNFGQGEEEAEPEWDEFMGR